MKCFRSLLISVFIVFSSICFADKIVPINNSILEVGELNRVRLISEKSLEEVSKIAKSKIGDILYVLSIRELGEDYELRVFVVPPPEKLSENRDYIIEGFEFKNTDNKKMKDFLVIEKEFNIKEYRDYSALYIGLSIFVLLTLLVAVFFIIKRKKDFLKNEKRRHKEKVAKKCCEFFTYKSSRSLYEEIYKRREIIRDYLDIDEREFITLLEAIDSIQFKKNWSEADIEKLDEMRMKFSQVRVKDGL